MIDELWVNLGIPLLGVLCGLLALLAGKHQKIIKGLKHDVFVLSNITGRNDIYKQIVFEPRQSSEHKKSISWKCKKS